MAKSKQETIDYIIGVLEKMSPGNNTIPMIRETLESKSEKEFRALAEKAVKGEFVVPLYFENMGETQADKDRLIDVAAELGIKLHERIIHVDEYTGEENLSAEEALVVPQLIRRQSQHLEKKKSLPDNSKKIDILTGQVTGESKGASMSMPELVALAAKNYNRTLVEVVNIRGGNEKAYRSMLKSVEEVGQYNLKPLEEAGTRVKVAETLRAILFSMHLENNL